MTSTIDTVDATGTDPIMRMNPETLPDAGEAGYSQISITEPGRLAFISGQVAWRPAGEPVPDNLADQAAIIVDNARAALKAAGAAPRDIVMVRVYLVDLTPERVEQVWPSLHELFEGTQPSLTGIGVAALAGPDLQLEVELVARVPCV
ncbi:RidA family protein [Roseibium sp. RKSG952]|uniref:RidA family protein n=1 Tax=Roseibium sp. RKSG952 TaxID=2529384 RepID=UPI0012BD2547|nr:RidA family protein [Roseibium sp. RKSG952]MTH96887.1 RidA family protein [Roseibium sp. RKSG952]